MSSSRVPSGDERAAVDLMAAGGEAWVHARCSGRSFDYLSAAVWYGTALALPDIADWVDEPRLRERERECWAQAASGSGGDTHVLILNPWLAVLPEPAREEWHQGDQEGFERELRLADLFSPGTFDRLLAVMRRYAGPGESATEIVERLASSQL